MNEEKSIGKYQKCLNPTCENLEETRGLCNSCYAQARYFVKHGKTTWEKLEAEGKTKPKRIVKSWLLSTADEEAK